MALADPVRDDGAAGGLDAVDCVAEDAALVVSLVSLEVEADEAAASMDRSPVDQNVRLEVVRGGRVGLDYQVACSMDPVAGYVLVSLLVALLNLVACRVGLDHVAVVVVV